MVDSKDRELLRDVNWIVSKDIEVERRIHEIIEFPDEMVFDFTGDISLIESFLL